MQKRVRGVFERIQGEMSAGGGEEEGGRRWTKVDAGNDKDVVQGIIWDLVEPLLGGIEGPVNRLWEEHLLQPTS